MDPSFNFEPGATRFGWNFSQTRKVSPLSSAHVGFLSVKSNLTGGGGNGKESQKLVKVGSDLALSG